MINLHLYHSNLTFETRILKITKFLKESSKFKEILILGKRTDGLQKKENIDRVRTLIRIQNLISGSFFISKVFGFIEWNIRVFIFLFNKKINLVNAHSLTVLPLAFFISFINNAKLVYEPHEVETETANTKKILKKPLKILEKFLIKKANLIYTVGEDISDFYNQSYGIDDVGFVLNIPEFQNSILKSNILKNKFSIEESSYLFLYQGLLNVDRGIRILLEVFKNLDASMNLVLMGYGPMEKKIKEEASKSKNIFFHPAVSQTELYSYTSSADIGVCFLTNNCLSYRLSLPNKLFEYFHSNIPVIVNESQISSKKMIKKYNCGFVFKNDVNALKKEILKISHEHIKEKKDNIHKVKAAYNWDEELKKLQKIYSNLLNDSK